MTTHINSNQANQPRTLIFGFLAILGGILFYFLGYGPLTKILQARHWVAVPTQVETSTLIEGIVRTKDGTHKIYKVNIQYPYQYNGKWYQGNQYNFNNFYSSDYNRPKNVLSDYPVGKKFLCYVNPVNPLESVIQRGLDWYLLPGIMPLILLCIGIGGLCIRPKTPQINDINTYRPFQIKTNLNEEALTEVAPQTPIQNKDDAIVTYQPKPGQHQKNQSPN